MSARPVRRIMLIAVGLLATFVTTALATGNDVHVRRPRNAQANVPYRLAIHGHAVGRKVLYIFLDDHHTCARTPAKEHTRANGFIWPVRGDFAERASVTTQNAERAHACAYLVKKSAPKNPRTGIVAADFVAFTIH